MVTIDPFMRADEVRTSRLIYFNGLCDRSVVHAVDLPRPVGYSSGKSLMMTVWCKETASRNQRWRRSSA